MDTVQRILIVDDENSHRRTLAIALRFEGFQVSEAASGEEALSQIESLEIDAALVDVVMPGMNGIDLAKRLHSAHPRVKIVLVSAYHLSERQIRLSGTGAVAFLPKPYRMNMLVEFLRKRIGGVLASNPEIL